MNNINYNPNERFYDFSLAKEDLDISCCRQSNEDQFDFFVSKLNYKHKQLVCIFQKIHLQKIIFKKRLDNLNAMQNGIIYRNGKDDKKIALQNYKDYYHLIFEYDISKLKQIKDILHDKYNIENVNLYQYDEKNLIYIFDKDSNFETKINSPLFSNLNNRINNYKKENLIYEQKYCSTDQIENLCENQLKNQSPQKFWYCNDNYDKYTELNVFNNIFDQNWYNKFCKNIKLFFNQITK